MFDLGPFFDNKPFLRTVLSWFLAPALAVTAWIFVLEPFPEALERREIAIRKAEKLERSRAEWKADWRGRPYHEMTLADGLPDGDHPTIFRLVCDYDRQMKSDFARAIIEDKDGLPGLEGLRPDDTIRLDMKFGRDNWFERSWTMKTGTEIVSDDKMHFRLSGLRFHEGDIATFRLADQHGNQSELTLPLTGARTGTIPFFEDCIEKPTRRG